MIQDILADNSKDQSEKIISLMLVLHTDQKVLKNSDSTTAARTTALEDEVFSLKIQLSNVKREVVNFKNLPRKNNSIVHKFSDTDQNNADIQSNILTVFQKACKDFPSEFIVEAKRLSHTPGNRPVLVKFNSSHAKGMLFNNIVTLRENGISISNDLDKKDREDRKKIIELLPRLREMGLSPKLKDAAVEINDIFYDLADLEKILFPTQIHAARLSPPPAKQAKMSFPSSATGSDTPRIKARRRKKATPSTVPPSTSGTLKQSHISTFLTPPPFPTQASEGVKENRTD